LYVWLIPCPKVKKAGDPSYCEPPAPGRLCIPARTKRFQIKALQEQPSATIEALGKRRLRWTEPDRPNRHGRSIALVMPMRGPMAITGTVEGMARRNGGSTRLSPSCS